MTSFEINGRRIGKEEPCYLIAELSANHLQQLDRALAIIDAAAECGADAIKLQTYTPDTITLNSDADDFRVGGGTLWDGRTLHELYAEAMTPWEWHPQLMARAKEKGLHCFSSPFDESAVDFLEGLEVPAYKVASFEIGHHPLLRAIARTGKPVILSTGIASLEDIDEALRVLREAGATDIALLKCTSAYPAAPEDAQLRAIPFFAERFGVVTGLSDHTMGTTVPVAAVALGARIVEKHLTLRRADGGPDGAFSLEPEEFKEMVDSIRLAEAAIGSGPYELTAKQIQNRAFARSIYVCKDVEAGEVLSEHNLKIVRPSHGLPPREWEAVLGRRARVAIKSGSALNWEHLESETTDP